MESLLGNNAPRGLKRASRNLQQGENSEDTSDLKAQAAYRTLNSFLDNYDFWFLPVINPDGYMHSQTSDRLWRKTRSKRSFCPGVDPNRNYPFHWRESGASSNPCHETFAGPKPLSEPETEALAKILSANKDRISMYISLHSYSQLILLPYGYARAYPDNYNEMMKVALRGQSAIASVRGTRYRSGTSASLLYEAAGGSDDYARGTCNIKLAFTIELPDTGNFGFLLPPREIVPVGQETVAGIAAMVEAI